MPPCICRKIAHVINGGCEAHECFVGQNFLNEVSYFLGGVGYMWQPGRVGPVASKYAQRPRD